MKVKRLYMYLHLTVFCINGCLLNKIRLYAYIYWYFWWLLTRSWSNLFLSYLLFNSSIFICLSNLTYFQPLWFVFFFLKWNNKSQPCIFVFTRNEQERLTINLQQQIITDFFLWTKFDMKILFVLCVYNVKNKGIGCPWTYV